MLRIFQVSRFYTENVNEGVDPGGGVVGVCGAFRSLCGSPGWAEASPASTVWPYSIWHLRVTWFVNVNPDVCCVLLYYRKPLLSCAVYLTVTCCSVWLSKLWGKRNDGDDLFS